MRLQHLALAAAALAGGALASSADGFLGLFTGACPTGWSELPAAQGRLLLLVNNTFQAGAAIGFALSDGEDRAHAHAVSGAFDLPSREVSALGGSNTAAAHSGKQPLLPFLNETSAATSGLPFVQLTACRYNALSFAPAPVLPAGGVALWDPSVTTGCAAGSAPLDAASGRLLVVSNATGLATSAAPPLEPGQDVQHAHDWSVSIALDPVNFAGIHGCCDSDPAADGQHTAAGTSSPASLGLPYLALLACNASAGPAAPALPAGMLLLSAGPSGCPAGWAPLGGALAGRAVVATPPHGVPGKAWGGAPLTPAALFPAHAHGFSVQVALYPAGVELAGSSGGDYGRRADIEAEGSTDGAVVGSAQQLPLALLLACQRSA